MNLLINCDKSYVIVYIVGQGFYLVGTLSGGNNYNV